MPDITLCMNQECPKKESCYRFMAIPDVLQSYASFPGGEDCDHFMPIEEGMRVKDE